VPAPGATPGTTTDCGQVNGGTASPAPPGTVCIAGGLNPGATSGAGAPQRLPRTGPSHLLPTLATGLWLVLLGALAGFAGRRRTARG
jgi:LPXTG-motif cell wall-anchored protein